MKHVYTYDAYLDILLWCNNITFAFRKPEHLNILQIDWEVASLVARLLALLGTLIYCLCNINISVVTRAALTLESKMRRCCGILHD